jgi:prevent-host-death family protein
MKIANIAEFKNRLSEYLALVDQGEEIEVRKYNIPVVRVMLDYPHVETIW